MHIELSQTAWLASETKARFHAGMPRILTVTLNPAVDLSTSTPNVQPTHKLRCRAPVFHPGGGGINVARVIQRLGADCAALFTVGGATGVQLAQLVADEGVSAITVSIAQPTRESIAVVDEARKDEYRFVMPGPTLTQHEWQACLAKIEMLEPAPAFVVASGSLPPGVPADFYAQLARVVHACGAHVVVDTSGPALAAALDVGVYLVKPSLRELEELVGQTLTDTTQRIDAARALVARGKAQMVALSLGAQGALLASGQGVWVAQPLAVQVAGTTGAGDSMLAAMIWALSQKLPMPQVLAWGVAAGSAALLSGGTALCTRADVERFVPQVVVNQMA
jgi:6-phosphofructokinase 2